MRNTTEILLKSRENQLAIDALIQTVVKHKFNGTVIAGIKTYGSAVINYLRAIEQQLFISLGISYTKVTYDPAVAYMVAVELPQLTQAYYIKIYYINRLTDMINEMVLEQNLDGISAYKDKFVGDQTGGANTIFAKGSTWVTDEQLIIDRLNDLITTIEADTIDQS